MIPTAAQSRSPFPTQMTWRIRIPLVESHPNEPFLRGTTDYFVSRPESDGITYDGVVLTTRITPDDDAEDDFFQSWASGCASSSTSAWRMSLAI